MDKQELIVSNPSFKEGDWIPRKHSARAEDISPQLNLQGISPKGKTIAITMDYASHPLFPNYNTGSSGTSRYKKLFRKHCPMRKFWIIWEGQSKEWRMERTVTKAPNLHLKQYTDMFLRYMF